jgi:hypothetical protein
MIVFHALLSTTLFVHPRYAHMKGLRASQCVPATQVLCSPLPLQPSGEARKKLKKAKNDHAFACRRWAR